MGKEKVHSHQRYQWDDMNSGYVRVNFISQNMKKEKNRYSAIY